MAADKKVKKAPAPKTTPAKGSAPKNAKAATKDQSKAKAATVKVQAQPQVKAQPKAVPPQVMAPPPKLITTDEFAASVDACLKHPHWSEISGPVLVEFKKFEETGAVTEGTRWAVKTAERVLKGMARSAEAAANEAYIAEHGADIVLRAGVCVKSIFWANLLKRKHPPARKMHLVKQAAAGRLTPKDIYETYYALVALEEQLTEMQTVRVHNGRQARVTNVGANSRGVKTQGRVLVQTLS